MSSIKWQAKLIKHDRVERIAIYFDSMPHIY